MKSKITFLSLAAFYLVSSNLAAQSTAKIETRDTLPAEKTTKATPIAKTDTTFADLENELNELNKHKKSDTTKIRVGKLKISITDDGENLRIQKEGENDKWESWGDWDSHGSESDFNANFNPSLAGISLGINNFMTADKSLTLPDTAQYLDLNTNRSIELALNFAELGIPIVKNRIGIVTGLGIKWNNYNLRNSNVVLHPDSTFLYHSINDTVDFTKSKLSAFYLTVPLMLEIQAPVQNHPLYIAAGVEAGLKIGSKTKMKTDNGIKNRNRNDFHLNPYTLALAARVGYDAVGIYATYNITTLFKNDEGPELYPFSLGITLNF